MSDTLREGSQIGPYKVEALLGQNDTGQVFRAYQPSLDRRVTLKVVDAAGRDANFHEQFGRHVRELAQLQHPNIVRIYDFGESGDVLYIAREFIDGTTLRAELGAPMPPQRACGIISQVAAALDFAHDRGVVHRDLKAGSILLGKDGRVLLTDFGLTGIGLSTTELTGRRVDLGTPDYMSPEQASADQAGAASDVYALGALSYHLLTGHLPFEAQSAMDVLHAHIEQAAPPASSRQPSLTPAVDAIFATALAKDPAARYPDGSTFAGALQDALGVAARQSPRVPRRELPSRRGAARWPRLLAMGGGALAVLVIAVVALARPGSRATPVASAPVSTPASPPTPAVSAASASTPEPEAPAMISSLIRPAASAGAQSISNANPPVEMAISRDGTNFAVSQPLAGVRGVFIGAVQLPDGGLRVYATQPLQHKLRAWISADYQGWTEEPVKADQQLLYGDMVRLADGSVRLYYIPLPAGTAMKASEPHELRSARSADGLSFSDEQGTRYGAPGLVSSAIAPSGDHWLLIAVTSNDARSQMAGQTLESKDGLAFTPKPGGLPPPPNGEPKMSAFDGGLHLLFSGNAVLSWTSRDERSWQLDPGVRQQADPGRLIFQPAIIKTSDGVYRLLYSLVSASSSSSASSSPPASR